MPYVGTSVLMAALTHERRTTEMQEWLAVQPAGELAVSEWVSRRVFGRSVAQSARWAVGAGASC